MAFVEVLSGSDVLPNHQILKALRDIAAKPGDWSGVLPNHQILKALRDIAAKPGDWLYYDEQFRFIRQSAPDQYPWDAIHWEVWLKAVTNFRPKPQFPSDKGHLRTRPQSFPKGTCWRFQAGKVCNGCRFDHVCFKCGSPHPATQCSSGQQHKGNPIKTGSTTAAPQAGTTRKGGSA